jgi:hypothetical protein
MLKATQQTKIDPIFAAIEAHRRAFAVYEPAALKLNAAADACEEGDILHEEHEAAADVMLPLHVVLYDANDACRPASIADL